MCLNLSLESFVFLFLFFKCRFKFVLLNRCRFGFYFDFCDLIFDVVLKIYCRFISPCLFIHFFFVLNIKSRFLVLLDICILQCVRAAVSEDELHYTCFKF